MMWPWEYTYKHEFVFWFLLIIPLVVLWYVFRTLRDEPEIRISSLAGFERGKRGWLEYLRHLLFAFKLIALSVLIMGMARPQTDDTKVQTIHSQGIDIVISMDLSVSMLSQDFPPLENRLEACKSVAIEFIRNRPSDQFGLVIYEGVGYTESPLTMDHDGLIRKLTELQPGSLAGGTAIGWGLATATNRLRESEGISKVVILLSDGVNNVRDVPPLQIAEAAREYGIKVYTIGVGSEGRALSPVQITERGKIIYDYVDVEIDEEMLRQIAEITGGQYFRAGDVGSLKAIYEEIDQMETREILTSQTIPKKEEYYSFVLWGAIVLGSELLLRNLLFKTIP